MSDPAVMVAIRQKLAGVAGIPTIIWPNEAKAVTPPYVVFDAGFPPLVATLTIDGQEAFEIRPQVSLLEVPNTFTATGDATLWAIAQAFSIGTRIFSGLTEVGQSLQTPVADGGRPDNGLFRRDMILRIASYQQI